MDFPKPLNTGHLHFYHASAYRHMVVRRGIEPRTHANQACVSPFDLRTRKLVSLLLIRDPAHVTLLRCGALVPEFPALDLEPMVGIEPTTF